LARGCVGRRSWLRIDDREITFKKGRVEQSNYDSYRVLRIDESPPVTDVHIVPASIDVPSSGVVEPGLPPFAPALCNAIFAATGKRIRRLPHYSLNSHIEVEGDTARARWYLFMP
jgi:hypothetical protein